MNLAKATLLSAAMGMGMIGVGYSVSPQFMFGLYGIQLESINELNMVRAAYGGLFIGFAALFALGFVRSSITQPALLALLTFMAGFAMGRMASIIMDGLPDILIMGLFALEVVYAALAIYLLRKRQGN